jgi:hypothetical protein
LRDWIASKTLPAGNVQGVGGVGQLPDVSGDWAGEFLEQEAIDKRTIRESFFDDEVGSIVRAYG